MVYVTSVSLPEQVYERAKKQAEIERRSLSNYIATLLEEKLARVEVGGGAQN